MNGENPWKNLVQEGEERKGRKEGGPWHPTVKDRGTFSCIFDIDQRFPMETMA